MLACVYNAFLQKHHQMEVRIVKKSRKPTKTNLSVVGIHFPQVAAIFSQIGTICCGLV
jgi:hypothetical protein